MQLYLSEYILESVVNVAYYYNNSDGEDTKILKLPPVPLSSLPIPVDTTGLNIILLFAMSRHGFPDGNQC